MKVLQFWPILCGGLLITAARHDAVAASLTTIYSFKGGYDGAAPHDILVAGPGLIYGRTYAGGPAGLGTVFQFDTVSSAERVLHRFAGGRDGSVPIGRLALRLGLIYGVTSGGGASNDGTVFVIDPMTGKERVIHSFAALPGAGMLAYGGALYGVSDGGTMLAGSLFSIDPSTGAETDFYNFVHNPNGEAPYPDGQFPCSDLIERNGTLYGTTFLGGANGIGAVLSYNLATGTQVVLHSFNGPDGGNPLADLLAYGDFLYGLAYDGGVGNNGVVFRINPANLKSVTLHAFTNGTDGTSPAGGVTAYGGKLYGVTYKGGSGGAGTIFTIAPGGGSFETLYGFSGGQDGANPASPLIMLGGAFYGTTTAGGAHGFGTIFRFTP